MAGKKKNNSKDVPHHVIVNIRLEPKHETPFYYVNYMSVANSAYEFTIGVARVPLPLTADQIQCVEKKLPVVMEPTLQLIFPPAVAKGLIKALTDQVGKFEEQFGKIEPEVQQNDKTK